MLRFKARSYGLPTEATWPDYKQGHPSTPFSERPSLRQLVVVVDHAVLERAAGDATAELGLLAGLLTHPYIRLLRYADEGPAADATRIRDERLGELVPGWLIVGKRDAEYGGWPVSFADPGGKRRWHSAIVGNAVEVAESDDRTGAYEDLGREEAAARRRADAVAVQAAASAHADLFITEREFLHVVSWDLPSGVLVARPADALPLVSLYLRAQGEFISYRSKDGTGTETMNRGLFYWVGTRELLPSGWRWFSACVEASADDETLIYLGQSVFQRVQRALEARDAAYRALNQPQNNDSATEALANLDLVLLGLMAAMDVTARVAHRALGFTGNEYEAGWQRNGWVGRVRREVPELAGLVADETEGGRTLLVLRRLRNSIHGAALDHLAVSRPPGRREETLVGLPHADTDDLLEAIDALGGRDAWGVRELIPHRAHADPGVLLDRVVVRALELIDDLMRLTPIERLLDANIPPESLGPPDDQGIFDQWTRQSIRWQLGL
jgi:hypothetical protein